MQSSFPHVVFLLDVLFTMFFLKFLPYLSHFLKLLHIGEYGSVSYQRDFDPLKSLWAPPDKPLKFSTLSLNISKILPFPLFYTISKWTYLFSPRRSTLSTFKKIFIYNTYFNVIGIYQLSFLLSSNFSLYVHRSVYNCKHQKSRSYHRKNPTASAFLNLMLFFST